MSFIKDNLMKDEIIICTTNLHWAMLLWPIILFIVGMLLININNEILALGGLFILFGIISAVISLINYKTSKSLQLRING